MLLSVIVGLGKYQGIFATMDETIISQLRVVFGGRIFQFHNGVKAVHIQ